MRKFILVLLVLVYAGSSYADDLKPESLDEEVLAAKREGVYYTGVPALAFSPDSGFIYGILMFRFDNGSRDDERFKYTPYLNKTNLLAVQSTKGLNQFKLNADLPFFAETPYRVYPAMIYTRNISEQYFGVNESTMSGLQYPDQLLSEQSLASPDNFTEYQEELQKKRASGSTYFRYHHYIHTEQEFSLEVERAALSRNFLLKAGFRLRDIKVQDYSGEDVVALEDDGDETEGLMGTTKLQLDREAGLLVAPAGAAIHMLTFEARYDTRDFEPDPRRGIVASFGVESSFEQLGSSQSYALYSTRLRGYYSPIRSLTTAGQLAYDSSEGEVPFFDLPSVGGRNSLKGFRAYRFRSAAASQANFEARWRAFQLGGESQSFVFTPIGFVDWGRVYDHLHELSGDSWQRSAGAGLRVIWNQATVIAFEYSLAGEENSLYVNINHIF